MQLDGLIRSRGFCPSKSIVCSAYPAFGRRGAHPAWSLAACFTLPVLRHRYAHGSLMPKTVAARIYDPLDFTVGFHLADELLMICYRRRYLFAIRLLLEHHLKFPQH
jgi:hypothetical protein